MSSRQPGGEGSSDTAQARLRSAPLDRQRAEFLRSCRARIKPADLGLPVPQRKRSDGLRREDVAALSGVSVSWYTWLEQGRDIRVSDEVLERLCNTFQLTDGERTYLFTLVQHRPPRLQRDVSLETVPPEIVRMIDALAMPAVAMNLRWDVLAWNRLNTLIFRDYGESPPSERNLAQILFTQESFYSDPRDFEEMAARVLAILRVDYSRTGQDPTFASLIRHLQTVSPVFRRMWRRPEINAQFYGVNRFRHPVYGQLALEHTSYIPDGYPGLRVVTCTPVDAATLAAVTRAAKGSDFDSGERASSNG